MGRFKEHIKGDGVGRSRPGTQQVHSHRGVKEPNAGSAAGQQRRQRKLGQSKKARATRAGLGLRLEGSEFISCVCVRAHVCVCVCARARVS